MTTSDDLYAAQSFGEFWEHYQKLHANPRVRAAHAVATAAGLGLFFLAIKRRALALALAAPLVDHAIAQGSHRYFDGTSTRPLRRPWWHARAEWRLFRETVREAEYRLHDKL